LDRTITDTKQERQLPSAGWEFQQECRHHLQ